MREPVNTFMQELEQRYAASANTVRIYGDHIRRLRRHLKALNMVLTDASAEDIQKYIAGLQNDGLSRRAIGGHISAFRAFYAFAEERGLCPRNPAARIVCPSYKTPPPAPASSLEADRLVDSTGTGTIWDARDRIVVEMVRVTGIRPFELVALNRQDIDLTAGKIRVVGCTDKPRALPLSPSLIKDLTCYLSMLGDGCGPLIVNRFHKRTTTRTIDRIFAKYAKVTNSTVTPRALRHALALKIVGEGGTRQDLQKRLGFSNEVSAAFYCRTIKRCGQPEAIACVERARGDSQGPASGSQGDQKRRKSDRRRRGSQRRFFAGRRVPRVT